MTGGGEAAAADRQLGEETGMLPGQLGQVRPGLHTASRLQTEVLHIGQECDVAAFTADVICYAEGSVRLRT